MEYLKKDSSSEIISNKWNYENHSIRIKEVLLSENEQNGFCAYSERYFNETDEVHLEHFDPRIKNTPADNYYNWYATMAWLNSHKPKKIEPFLPILSPSSEDLAGRIKYQEGFFYPVDKNDIEADNLIKYLGFNKYELTIDRNKHINRLKFLLQKNWDDNTSELENYLIAHPSECSFISAIRAEFNIDI